MAVAINGTPQKQEDYTNSAITSLTIGSFVVPSSTDIVIVAFAGRTASSSGTISGTTLGGSSSGWTPVTSAYISNGDANSMVDWWYKLSPSAGTSALVGTWNTGQGFASMHAICLSGVDTGAPFGTVVTNTLASGGSLQTFTGSALTAPSGSMSLSMMNGWGDTSSGDCLAVQTEIYRSPGTGARYDVSQYTTSVNPSMSYTRVDNYSGALDAIMSSLVILPSTGGGGSTLGSYFYNQIAGQR